MSEDSIRLSVSDRMIKRKLMNLKSCNKSLF